jgi:hypothetical protein
MSDPITRLNAALEGRYAIDLPCKGRSVLRSALVAALLTSALGMEGHAQGEDGLSLGVKAGLNAGSFLNADFESSRLIGLTAGGFMDYPLTSALDLRV